MENALTVDVEDYFHVSAFAGVVSRESWAGREARVVPNTDYLLALFAERRVKATFFVLGWVAERNPALVRRIADGGHEVACHGYSHELVYRQSRKTFADETVRSKSLLEDITGRPVVGYRAASYSITPRSQWAIDVLAEAGFGYDSSIFPIRHDRYGWPGSPDRPHLVRGVDGGCMVEFPLSVARVGGFGLPVAGGGYFRLLPFAVTDWGLQRLNQRERRPFVFYLHPWEVDPDQPRIAAGALSRFRHYVNLHRTAGRLKQLLDRYRFNTMAAVLEREGFGVHERAQQNGAARLANAGS